MRTCLFLVAVLVVMLVLFTAQSTSCVTAGLTWSSAALGLFGLFTVVFAPKFGNESLTRMNGVVLIGLGLLLFVVFYSLTVMILFNEIGKPAVHNRPCLYIGQE